MVTGVGGVVVAAAIYLSGAFRGSDEPVPVPADRTVDAASFVPQSVAFWDVNHGVAAGTATCIGTDCEASTVGIVQLTEDSGATWTSVLDTASGLTRVSVASTGAAWAITKHGDLWRTADAGETWDAVGMVPRYDGSAELSFASPQLGWAVVQTSEWELYRTEDGGATWQRIDDPCHGSVPITEIAVPMGELVGITDISLAAPDAGWILCSGEGAAGSSPQAVFSSTDGGTSWTLDWSGFQVSSAGLQMLSSGDGVRWDQMGGVAGTTDGGATWSQARQVDLPEFSGMPLSSVSVVSPTAAYALIVPIGSHEPAPTLLMSSDDGASWRVVRTFATPSVDPG